MSPVLDLLLNLLVKNGLLTAFALVGATMWLSYQLSAKLTRGRLHGSALAIMLGLLAAYVAGVSTGGKNGVVDVKLLGGVGLLGGAMLRDFAIVSTAYGATLSDMRKCGVSGVVSLLLGVVLSFVVGAGVALAFGYTDAVSVATIGAGAVTYIVGPVTGAAIGASSELIALSIAAGLVKSVLVMVGAPLFARSIGLDNPRTAMVFGGMMGTTSGVCGALAAIDPRLVPYGAMTSTFYTGLGCLMGPSVLFFATKALLG
ncbi:malonate transporter subunit MadM [Pseudorhodoferax soli]|jgi:malonate transporter MadM subunit|uniref:Malonate transporter MadM subunit n=1 Tax=Pseudorhodoferax soli TaxID=545864 RepID=A0A368XKX0_9BURK|nr:malonate transporter subunit MadM [Pseudorhodoferax soli]RCW66674.1 malonate transporter MadM subunit [Pseudorhodoferax soli]